MLNYIFDMQWKDLINKMSLAGLRSAAFPSPLRGGFSSAPGEGKDRTAVKAARRQNVRRLQGR